MTSPLHQDTGVSRSGFKGIPCRTGGCSVSGLLKRGQSGFSGCAIGCTIRNRPPSYQDFAGLLGMGDVVAHSDSSYRDTNRLVPPYALHIGPPFAGREKRGTGRAVA